MKDLIKKVEQWGRDRNIIGGATALAQQTKLEEEVAELRAGLEQNNADEVVDAIGDTLVVLILQSAIVGVRIEDCLASAYEVIKDRKGKMHNGMFVKEADFERYGIS